MGEAERVVLYEDASMSILVERALAERRLLFLLYGFDILEPGYFGERL